MSFYSVGVPSVTRTDEPTQEAASTNAASIEITINYETFGFDDGPALLLVNGLGSQLNGYPPEFCEGFVDRGFFVIRYDNRDVGLSSRTPEDHDYTVSHMAADGMAVLDDLNIDAAHIAGMSMGGMIVQTMAIEHPDRVLTMTSIMSTTSERDYGKATDEAMTALLTPPLANVQEAIEQDVVHRKIWASPEWYDEELVREYFVESWARAADNRADRQYAAIMASGHRGDLLPHVQTPTLVIHGDEDTLIDISGGRRTAELLPNAEILEIEGMGHDLPKQFWQQIIHAITALASENA